MSCPCHDLPLRAIVRADLGAAAGKAPGEPLRPGEVAGLLLLKSSARAVLSHRVAHALWHRGLPWPALYLRSRALRVAGAEIHPAAQIGPGFYLVHANGVAVGHGVRTGAGCRMHHQTSLGELGPGAVPGHNSAWPVLADHVSIGTGAKVLGPVRLGEGAVVAANAVVLADVPAYTMVGGVPARELRPVDPATVLPRGVRPTVAPGSPPPRPGA